MIETTSYMNAMSQKETMAALNLLLVIASAVVLFMAKPSLEQEIFNPLDYEAMGDGETDDALVWLRTLVYVEEDVCEMRCMIMFGDAGSGGRVGRSVPAP